MDTRPSCKPECHFEYVHMAQDNVIHVDGCPNFGFSSILQPDA